MPPFEWTVGVYGEDRHITVEVDPQRGKAAVRVDGRIAARPIAPDEQEREFLVGPFTYRLTRGPDGFSLEQVEAQPPETLAENVEAPRPPEPSYIKIGLWTLAILVVLGLGYRVYDYFAYWRVPWAYRYVPPDNGFRISFPDKPVEDKSTVVLNGRVVAVTSLYSSYREHRYTLVYWDTQSISRTERMSMPELTETFLEQTMSALHGTLSVAGALKIDEHQCVEFVASIPETDSAPGHSIRGVATFDRRRVIIAFAIVPPGKALAMDVGEYLRSLALP